MTTSKKSTTPPKLKITSMTITVEKAIQVRQFEPVRVSVTQTVALEDGNVPRDIRDALYDSTSRATRVLMREELSKWRKGDE